MILNLKPPCGYNPGGITDVRALLWDDFTALAFDNDALYDSCLVTEVQRSGDFNNVQPDIAKYSGPISNKIVTHTLDTFIGSLQSDYAASLHLASRNRYVVVFTGADGNSYIFGIEAGAVVSYTGQTDGALGYTVTFTCSSIYPLFQLTPDALNDIAPTSHWLADFVNGAYCEVQ